VHFHAFPVYPLRMETRVVKVTDSPIPVSPVKLKFTKRTRDRFMALRGTPTSGSPTSSK
jgi:hypothetical protein